DDEPAPVDGGTASMVTGNCCSNNSSTRGTTMGRCHPCGSLTTGNTIAGTSNSEYVPLAFVRDMTTSCIEGVPYWISIAFSAGCKAAPYTPPRSTASIMRLASFVAGYDDCL